MWFKKKQKPRYCFEDIFRTLIFQMEAMRGSEKIGDLFKTILNLLGAHNGSLFLFHKDDGLFELQKWVGEKPLQLSILQEYEFLSFLRQVANPVFKDEVVSQSHYLDVRSSGITYFTQLSAAGVVPLMVKGEWIGLLNFGRKLSGPYDTEDRDLLSLLGNWLSHTVANEILFEEVKHQNSRFAEMNRMKSELMANVTHELRTPLNGIMGLTDLILEGADGDVNEEQRRHLKMIKDGGESLLEIVNNILSLLKIESSRNKIEIKRLEFKRMVAEIAALFEGVLSARANRFQCLVPDDLMVFGDEDQIRTILMNLLGNAAKFTQNGQIEVLAHRSGDMARICVKDSGMGIADNDQEKIFEEFQQGDGSITRHYGGTGLGLAIAKKIVELHGGRIWVDSVQGKGSEFYFTLPIKPILQTRERE